MSFHRLYARAVFWPTWGWNLLLGRALRVRAWWNEIEPGVLLGARPLKRDIPRLAAMGVRAIVNTCEEFAGHAGLYAKFGIRQLHIPATDFQPPALEQVDSAVAFIDAALERGETVYVHCKAGRARSATVLICWLMKARGLSINAAQQRLLEARPHVNPRLGERAVVKAFASRLQVAGETTG